jgi:hypothetical protein
LGISLGGLGFYGVSFSGMRIRGVGGSGGIRLGGRDGGFILRRSLPVERGGGLAREQADGETADAEKKSHKAKEGYTVFQHRINLLFERCKYGVQFQ